MEKYELDGKCRRGHALDEKTLKVNSSGANYCSKCESLMRQKRHKARLKSDPDYRERTNAKMKEASRRYRQRKADEIERIADQVLAGELDIGNESVTERALRIVEARRAGNALTWGSEVDLTSTLVRPSAKKQWDAFQEAKQNLANAGVDWNCKDKWEEFALYSDENAPTAEQAQEMCGAGTDDECPLLKLCDTYATAQRETDGVWGGKQRRRIREDGDG